ncbi:anti-sigma regulatory factor (Ser/Thr protein kinase) [Streptosporangium album]|uniref:Anti-sigma regulatory factor (Ser/Thr protein kinase) n=1 Tax=Streptosporangium album TaxID=47479 RepID=A0A7W7S1L9_9ACTN|nr:ATP-binding protein [Streptosporangium album]MBB4942249.1 anti-sigma regulatory factor (Ser/Thr protein kinase) [Streptosporangium album]
MRPPPYGPADPFGTRAECLAGPTQRTSAGTGISATAQGDIHMLVRLLRPGSVFRRARAVVREVLQAEGVPGNDIADAETVVAELAANCERHARPPYELRVFSVGGIPTWCELVDGDPDLGWIPVILNRPHAQTALDLFAENGRGLLLVRELSQGHCRAYPTTTFTTDGPAKAVAFALPTRSGTRLICPPLLRLGRRSARLQMEP